MFHIKICGVRKIADVDAVIAAGADAIGVNFFPKSVRYLDPESQATSELVHHAKRGGLTTVGVFVNESAESMLATAERVGFDVVQLHGDETVGTAESVVAEGLPVIRALKLKPPVSGRYELDELARDWVGCGCRLLLDADAGAAHGGSGKTLDWDAVAQWAQESGIEDWLLAGGLAPGNVAQAIQASGATSVDVASGVESPRGVKSAERITAFASSARKAFVR